MFTYSEQPPNCISNENAKIFMNSHAKQQYGIKIGCRFLGHAEILLCIIEKKTLTNEEYYILLAA